MNRDFAHKFFQGLYSAELEHKDRLESADNLLVGVLIVLSGVGMYYLGILPSGTSGWAWFFFILFAVCFVLAFILATMFVILSFWPREIAYLSSPETLSEYMRALEAHFSFSRDPAETDRRVEAEFQAVLRKQFVAASEINRKSNIEKMGSQTKAKRCITAAVLVILLNAYPAYLVQFAHSEPQKVEVIKLPKIPVVRFDLSDLERKPDGTR